MVDKGLLEEMGLIRMDHGAFPVIPGEPVEASPSRVPVALSLRRKTGHF
jgi:hypothetical protein